MASTQEKPKAFQSLSSVPYFSKLDTATLESIARIALRRIYHKDQTILLEGDPNSGLHVVESGWLKVIKISIDGREQVLQILGPGDTFNAIGVFTGIPNPATVMALETSAVCSIRRETMLRLLDEHPSLAKTVIQELAERVLHLVNLVEDLSLRSVESRLARLLLEKASGTTVQRERWATQAEMASQIGTVPDVLNRALRKLADEGTIEVARHQICILDREKLTASADLMPPP
jgi:CRP/FNR family transcriptional regulator